MSKGDGWKCYIHMYFIPFILQQLETSASVQLSTNGISREDLEHSPPQTYIFNPL